jgi:ribonuclease D
VSRWIRTREELAALAEGLPGCRALALDSESDSLYHHFEKVCLVQLATDRGDAYLIDTLALKDLSALAGPFADPGTLKVMHGADYDVTTLKRDFGIHFAGLFDTMIAARFLGLPAVGLQALARSELGIELSKDSQKDDWSRRPLTPAQEDYALADVRHLIELQRLLAERLREKGRLEWVLEECTAVAGLEAARRRRDPEAFLALKGASRLPRRGLAVLRELHAWRERQAEATDRPPFRIIANEALLALAAQPPRNAAELARSRQLPPRLKPEAPGIFEGIARALAVPESELPRVPVRQPRPVQDSATRRRIDALREWRSQESARLELDVSLLLPQRLLERVAEAAPADAAALQAVAGLRDWRARRLGPGLLAALEQAAGQPARLS